MCGVEGFDPVHDDGSGVPVGQPVLVRLVHDPAAPGGGAAVGGQPLSTQGAGVAGQGTDSDDRTVDLQLDTLAGPDLACRHGVEAGLEGDQAALLRSAIGPGRRLMS